MVELTIEECRAVRETISMLGGGNPEYVFSFFSCGEEDDPKDPFTSAFAKIYHAVGASIPPNCKEIVGE